MKDKFIEYKYPSGGVLRYIKNKVSKSTMFEIRFDGGTRLNTIPGLAHFCEHMVFGGTDKLSEEEVTEKYFDFIQTNAQTSPREISFSGNIITKEFSSYLDLLAEMLTKSTFKTEVVKKECNVIKQEISAKKDKYSEHIYWQNLYNLFGYDYYKYTNLGTTKSVESITSEDLKNFTSKNLVKESMIVHITSPLKFKTIKKLISEKLESKLPSNPDYKMLPIWGDTPKKEKFLILKHQEIEKTYITINLLFKADAFDFENVRVMNLIVEMMRQVNGLYKALRIDNRLVYSFYLYTSYYGDIANLTFETNCDKQNVNEVIKTYANYIRETLKNGFTESSLKQTKRKKTHKKETSEPRASKPLARLDDLYYFGKILDRKKLDDYEEKVTLNDCNDMFKFVLTSSKVSATLFGDITKDELIKKEEFNNLFDFKNFDKDEK